MEKPSGDGFSSTLASLLAEADELANVQVIYTKRILVSIPFRRALAEDFRTIDWITEYPFPYVALAELTCLNKI